MNDEKKIVQAQGEMNKEQAEQGQKKEGREGGKVGGEGERRKNVVCKMIDYARSQEFFFFLRKQEKRRKGLNVQKKAVEGGSAGGKLKGKGGKESKETNDEEREKADQTKRSEKFKRIHPLTSSDVDCYCCCRCSCCWRHYPRRKTRNKQFDQPGCCYPHIGMRKAKTKD